MESHFKIINDLENELTKTEEISRNISEQMEFAIGHCKIALNHMRELVVRNGFPNNQSEIYFFKELKPRVYGKLLYYQAVIELESNRIVTPKAGQKQFFEKELEKVSVFMEENKVKVQYYRNGFEHLDEKYFLRDESEIPVQLKNYHSLMDEGFFTWHDHTFSVILANDLLAGYIQEELDKLDKDNQKGPLQPSGMTWTGSKVAAVEMVYALKESGVVNNGDVEIKELASWVENTLDIDLKDYYRCWQEIKQRKAEPTKFLDYLVQVLRKRIDDSNA